MGRKPNDDAADFLDGCAWLLEAARTLMIANGVDLQGQDEHFWYCNNQARQLASDLRGEQATPQTEGE